MTDLIVVPQTNQWTRLKALVLDSVSSPITKRVYNLGLDEFFAWLSIQEPRPGFTKATVSAWRVALEGWTNETLAERLKISDRAVSSIRNNGDYHGIDAVTKLANLMGRDVNELYLP